MATATSEQLPKDGVLLWLHQLLTVLDQHHISVIIIVFSFLAFVVFLFKDKIIQLIDLKFPTKNKDEEEIKKVEKEALTQIESILNVINDKLDEAINSLESFKSSQATKEDLRNHYNSIHSSIQTLKETVKDEGERIRSDIDTKTARIINKIEKCLLEIKGEIQLIAQIAQDIKRATEGISGDIEDLNEDLQKHIKKVTNELNKIEDLCSEKDGTSRF